MKHFLVIVPWIGMMLLASCGENRGGGMSENLPADTLSADRMGTDSTEEDFSYVDVPKAADELFDDFIFNFAGNEKLQRERIVFPLQVTELDQRRTISKREWTMQHFFMRQGYYTLIFDNERHKDVVKDTAVNHAVVEKIHFARQTVRQYVFNRIRQAWMMTQIVEMPLDKSSNASFLEFYQHFATDTVFQTSHLEPTVKFVGPDADDDFRQMEGIITPDTWEAFAPLMPSKLLYNIVYGYPEQQGNTKVFVLRGVANGLELEMTFVRRGKVWRLHKLMT